MTSTSWHRLLGFSAGTVLVAACTFSSGGDDDDGAPTTGVGGISGNTTSGGTGGTGGGTGGTGGTGGSAGDGGSGGATTTSTTTTNTTGSATGGTGGSDEVECLDNGDVPGDPAPTPGDDEACCWKCAASVCYNDGYADCFATTPNICGGTVEGDGSDSEILTLINCMRDIEGGAAPGTGVDSDFDICIGEAAIVASDVCGNGSISGPTNELAPCLAGDEDGLDGCFEECFNAEFDEAECLY
jgi:hypothetical protein